MVYLPHWPIPKGKNNIELGLERMKALLLELGCPHFNLPPIIHVAGTNGKGSTIAYLKCIFEKAGYTVHRYTSPHIKNFNERILIAGTEISDPQLFQLLEEVRIKTQGIDSTFFEATTAAAFLAFSRTKADILLLETGMGGRLDATNMIDKPLANIITPISIDHAEYLGDTIEKIAYEKAGIIKDNSLCISSWQMQNAATVIENKCKSSHTELYAFGKNWNLEILGNGFKFIDYQNEKEITLPSPSLFGIHQPLNAATAIAVINKLTKFEIQKEHLSAALKDTYWPARMEQINKGKLYDLLPNGWELWVDGAHNPNGALMIAETIRANWNDKPTFLINGRTGKRDIKGFLEPFKGIVQRICGVKVVSEPISESADNITTVAKELGFEAYSCSSIKDAILLFTKSPTISARIIICGSLYLAADIELANKVI